MQVLDVVLRSSRIRWFWHAENESGDSPITQGKRSCGEYKSSLSTVNTGYSVVMMIY